MLGYWLVSLHPKPLRHLHVWFGLILRLRHDNHVQCCCQPVGIFSAEWTIQGQGEENVMPHLCIQSTSFKRALQRWVTQQHLSRSPHCRRLNEVRLFGLIRKETGNTYEFTLFKFMLDGILPDEIRRITVVCLKCLGRPVLGGEFDSSYRPVLGLSTV